MIKQMKQTQLVFKLVKRVWLLAQAVALEGNPKLLSKWLGPFKITETLTNAYRLHLPSTIKIHLIINMKFLKLYVSSEASDPPCKLLQLPIKDGEFEVEGIRAHKQDSQRWLLKVK